YVLDTVGNQSSVFLHGSQEPSHICLVQDLPSCRVVAEYIVRTRQVGPGGDKGSASTGDEDHDAPFRVKINPGHVERLVVGNARKGDEIMSSGIGVIDGN